jgi:hypothetical protein
VTGTAGEASHPAAQLPGIHRKSASAALASGGGGGAAAARHTRRSIGGGPEGRLHSIDSGASDELGGQEPSLGHVPPAETVAAPSTPEAAAAAQRLTSANQPPV